MATRVKTDAETDTPCTKPLILHTILEKGQPGEKGGKVLKMHLTNEREHTLFYGLVVCFSSCRHHRPCITRCSTGIRGNAACHSGIAMVTGINIPKESVLLEKFDCSWEGHRVVPSPENSTSFRILLKMG